MKEYTPYTRYRPDRHPYQVGVLVGLISVALSQIIIGIPPESAFYKAIDQHFVISLNATFIVGGVMGLVGAAMDRDGKGHDVRLSLRFGIAGQFSILVAMMTYSLIIMGVTRAPYWLSLLSAGLGIALTYASGHRLFQQWRALKWTNRAVKAVKALEKGGYELPPPINDEEF